MNEPLRNDPPRWKSRPGGLGVLCREAQADGVPCSDRGRECAECGRAVDPPDPEEAIAEETGDWAV